MIQITKASLEAAKKAFEAGRDRLVIMNAAVPGAVFEERSWWEELHYAHCKLLKACGEPHEHKQAAYDLVCMIAAARSGRKYKQSRHLTRSL
jgi:hypothetical protein